MTETTQKNNPVDPLDTAEVLDHNVREDQEILTIGNEIFVADLGMIRLLQELHRVGLRITQHCTGHGERPAYLSISLESGVDVQICVDRGPRLVIFWPYSKKADRAVTTEDSP